MLTGEQKQFLLAEARRVIEAYIKNNKVVNISSNEKRLLEKRGIFVTLRYKEDHKLRGCIGFPEPILPLKDALKEAALCSATADPRFFPLAKEELSKIEIEISVLTKPALIKEPLKNIKIGTDGLIIKKGPFSGLLLPQVATEFNLKTHEFLEMTCEKAGLDKNSWKDAKTEIYKFQAQAFAENG